MSALSTSQTIKSLVITNQFATDILLLNTPNEIWQYLAQNIVEKLGFDDAVIYTLDANGKTLGRMSGFDIRASTNKEDTRQIRDTSANRIVIPLMKGSLAKLRLAKSLL